MKFIDRLNLWKKDSLEYRNKFMFDPYFIAEIGVNHENSIEKAKLMIEQAFMSGANAVKFQSYKADRLAAKDSPSYWDTTEEAAKKSVCGNCVAFDISPRMKDCLPGDTFDDDGELGYCWMHHFKCHSARACHTWAKGGPIAKDSESAEWQEKSNLGAK